MRMTVAAQKALKPQHVAILSVAKDDRSACAGFQDRDAAQNQRAHDAFAKFGFADHQRAQSLRRNDERVYGLLRNSIGQRRAAGQLREFPHEITGTVDDNGRRAFDIATVGDCNLAGEDNHQAGSDLTACQQRFSGRERAQFAEPADALDLQRIEAGKNLIMPLLGDRLQ